jgi:hypothetical protein
MRASFGTRLVRAISKGRKLARSNFGNGVPGRILNGGMMLMIVLTIGGCSIDRLASTVERQADPEGAECIGKGYDFASELYRACRNQLIDERAKQKQPETKGLY